MAEKLRKTKWKHYINYIVISIVAIIYSVLSFTGALYPSTLMLLEKIVIAILLAVSLSVVVGFLGELSIGHAGFMCIGAYLGGKTACLLEPVLGNTFLTLLISLVVGGALAAICGVIVGLPALRLKGDYLAIVTLAFGEIVCSLFMNSSEKTFGGPLGMNTPRYDKNTLFIIGFVLILICLAVIQNLIRSKHGRAITSIRDNEIAARATGINITKYKLFVFTIAAFFAGIAGVLHSFSNTSIETVKFNYNYSIEILVMVVLGGMGNINGAIIAATVITYINEQLKMTMTGNMAVVKDMIYALILIVIVIYNNAPALKGIREKYTLKKFIHKILGAKHDPSHPADDEAKWDRVPTKIEMNEVLSTEFQPTMSTVDPDRKGDFK